VRILLDGGELAPVRRGAAEVRTRIEALSRDVEVLGPAPLHRLRGRHRRVLLVRAERAGDAARPVAAVLDACVAELRSAGVRATVDVDPQDT
jgi:primosomal protein N'